MHIAHLAQALQTEKGEILKAALFLYYNKSMNKTPQSVVGAMIYT